MTWSEFKAKAENKQRLPPPIPPTDIDCQVCGSKIYKINTADIKEFPIVYLYRCKACGWEDTARK